MFKLFLLDKQVPNFYHFSYSICVSVPDVFDISDLSYKYDICHSKALYSCFKLISLHWIEFSFYPK